ncbi:hypothetical protein BD410DRAFT_846641 [Rickenella mellea]|uniref:Uncharacterized protein n=1 Tax=Rickenella mellea TaxID=50990 RepID=A0A4Y7PFE6_9AGAM|nr:hypothetical protein BD410DRAFT_846641 [Rickenella mellea]
MKGPPDADVELRKRLNEAGGIIGCAALGMLPKEWVDAQKIRNDVLNMPVVGCRENHGFFSAAQLNIARAVKSDSKDGMGKDIGVAADPHMDDGDAFGNYSVMTSYTDVPPGSKPGRIYFPETKTYRDQIPGAPDVFNGRRYHYASPPRVPSNMEVVPEWAYRLSFILYPNQFTTYRTGPIALSFGPDTKVIESDSSAAPGPPSRLAGNATFVRDGLNIMAKPDHDTFITRELYALVCAVLKGSTITVKNKEFFEAFGTVGPDGQFVPMGPWPLGPGGSEAALRESLLALLTKVDRRQTPFIFSMAGDGPTYGERRQKKSKRDANGNEIAREETQIDDRESDQEEEAPVLRRSTRLAEGNDSPNAAKKASTSRLMGGNGANIASHGNNQDGDSVTAGNGGGVLMTLFQSQNPSTSGNSLTRSSMESPTGPLSPLAQGLQHLLLSAELKNLLRSLLNQTVPGSYIDLSISVVPFVWFQDRFDANPLSHSAFSLSSHITSGLASAAHNMVHNKLHRAQAMFAHWRLWVWFIVYLEPALDEEILMASSPHTRMSPPRGWLEDLVKYVARHIGSGEKACQLTAAEIFKGSFQAPDFTMRSHTSLDLHAVIVPHIRTQCIDAITFWLGFGTRRSRSVWRLQGAVIGAIFNVFQGSGVLLSPTVWRAYSWPESFAFPPNSNNLSSEDQIDNLCESLCMRRRKDPLISPIFAHFDSIVQLHLPELHSSFYVATGQPLVHGPSLQQKSAEKVVAFMRDLYPILYKDPNSYSDLCNHVVMDIDKYSPFRELAPSRAMILTSPCYAHPAIYTRLGFFNALVFRAITYGADFLRKDKAKYFLSAIDFQSQVDLNRLKGGDRSHNKYFCRANAYGNATNRSLANVPLLWDKSDLWENFIRPYHTAHELVPFHAMQQWILKAKFKGVGDLTAFLLAGDLMYANVVSAPSPDSIGSTIIRFGKGPFSALKRLQVIGSKLTPGAEFADEDSPQVQAFVQLYHAVGELLLEREMELIGGFDVIIFEHTLCKMSRSSDYHGFFK